MFWELIGAIALGFGAGGFAYALRKLSRGVLPGWIVPVAAGCGMLGYSVYMDYAWSARAQETLPEGMEVVREASAPTWFKPWTFLAPPVARFAALDVAGARSNPQQPDLRLSTLFLYDRVTPPAPVSVLLDCEGGRIGRVGVEAGFGEDGLPRQVTWEDAAPGDAALSAVCRAD